MTKILHMAKRFLWGFTSGYQKEREERLEVEGHVKWKTALMVIGFVLLAVVIVGYLAEKGQSRGLADLLESELKGLAYLLLGAGGIYAGWRIFRRRVK